MDKIFPPKKDELYPSYDEFQSIILDLGEDKCEVSRMGPPPNITQIRETYEIRKRILQDRGCSIKGFESFLSDISLLDDSDAVYWIRVSADSKIILVLTHADGSYAAHIAI